MYKHDFGFVNIVSIFLGRYYSWGSCAVYIFLTFKIDHITSDGSKKRLTGQIVMLGNIMGLSVVAEGVETSDQLEYLTVNNCQKIQGYIFSKPVPEQEVESLLALY